MARKSKGFGELQKLQQRKQAEQKGLEKLQHKVESGAWGNNFAGMIANPKGEVKMSEVLEAFVEPYLDETHTYQERKKLFTLAVAAWNLGRALKPFDPPQPSLKRREPNRSKSPF
ncbi:MAG: hypothetical protein NW224_23845 [Leptolyngbyaceae cyanobacterium bins.302]|nr:hypothetical protein [Leptolyngbyaceae cyanobacterium bins.302]